MKLPSSLCRGGSLYHSRTFQSANGPLQVPSGDPNVLPANPTRRFIDTHAHMDLVLRRKRLLVSSASWTALSNAYLFSPSSHPDSQNLAGIVNINSDPSSYAAGKYLETFSDILFSTWGVHPLRASLYDDALEKTIEANLKMPKAVAVGECGLDYVKLDAANIGPAKFIQKMVFSRHLYLAKKTGKAIIVHMRGAENDTFDLLKDTLPEDHRIQMQCYTGTTELAKLVMDQFPNAVFGVAGLATYAGAAEKRDDIVNFLPLDRIVFESVAPHIPPEPLRGKVGHPGLIPYIAERIGLIKGVPVDDVYTNALKNTNRVFGLDLK